MPFFAGQYTSVYSLNHHITCRFEARQALIYQLVLGLTGENDMYNYSKAVHVYPPFFDITCSAKNYKIAPALTPGHPLYVPLAVADEHDPLGQVAPVSAGAIL